MMQKIVSGIGGVANFGVISICLFFAVFTTMLVWALCLKKPFLKSMEALPLRDDACEEGEQSHE